MSIRAENIDAELERATFAAREAMEHHQLAISDHSSASGIFGRISTRVSVKLTEWQVHDTEQNLGILEDIRAVLVSESMLHPDPITDIPPRQPDLPGATPTTT